MPYKTLSNFILLPELELTRIRSKGRFNAYYYCDKVPRLEYCPRCAQPSTVTYDHRTIRIKDTPIRGHSAILLIRKRRLWCKPCGKPFTESVPGIKKGKRHTERFVSSLHWACENFGDLKRVRRAYQCSSYFLYQSYYQHLERKNREKVNYPWPKIIGIDEHAFRRNPKTKRTEFASMIVDHVNRRVREVVDGKTTADLQRELAYIPGTQNVEYVTLDMCDAFKNYVKLTFPNAQIVADKFHVLRLLSPALLRKRKEISGTKANARARSLLLCSRTKLPYFSRLALSEFLEGHPELKELYEWKERLHTFYRTRGLERAEKALTLITDTMAHSTLQEIKTLRRTLVKWRREILNYFKTGLTNARVEGFNNKAKVVKRKGYGYKCFNNYRLRVLSACA